MKKFSILLLSLCLLLPHFSATFAQATVETSVRVGLFYGNDALTSANLENSQGAGYRFGYVSDDRFVSLGYTDQTQISMLKTQNIYLKNDLYYPNDPGGSHAVIGCYHLQFPQSYGSFDEAKQAATGYAGAFPAWIEGRYVLRLGAYPDKNAAITAQGSLGLSETAIVGTSAYGITVVRTKTDTVLFQLDNSNAPAFVVRPNLTDNETAVTWFKGYRYYGDFVYERIDGGNLVVSNELDMESYLKGILPYEMSASWPLEALKAQAVCARNYALTVGNKHKNDHFDICNTTCCQVYRGMNKASDHSDRAVTETRGVLAYYQGKPAELFYYASNGGASEDVKNVWGSDYPYLKGVKDSYESAIESSIPGYRWTETFTASALTSRLRDKGYDCNTIVDLKVTEYTPMGNVSAILFTDSSGATFSFTRERARTILGLKSMRFTISGGSGGGGTSYYVDDQGVTLPALSGQWSIGAGGTTHQLPGSGLYAITANGTEALSASSAGTGSGSSAGIFTVSGSGNGHHVGMSQWGAHAMAKQGMTYQDILKFYFTGIDFN